MGWRGTCMQLEKHQQHRQRAWYERNQNKWRERQVVWRSQSACLIYDRVAIPNIPYQMQNKRTKKKTRLIKKNSIKTRQVLTDGTGTRKENETGMNREISFS